MRMAENAPTISMVDNNTMTHNPLKGHNGIVACESKLNTEKPESKANVTDPR